MRFCNRARPARRPKAFRVHLEPLEGRVCLSVTVTTGDFNGNGTQDIRITSDTGNNTLTITDNPAAGTTTLSGAVNRTFSNQFQSFDISLGGDNNHVIFNVASNYTGARRSISADLGGGSSDFTFNTNRGGGTSSSITGSHVVVDVTGSGSDRATFNLNNLDSSMIILEASQSSGSLASTVNFNGDISNNTDASFTGDNSSTMGTNSATINTNGRLDDTSDLEIDYSGGMGGDTLNTNFNNRVDGDVSLTSDLGPGNDTYRGTFGGKFMLSMSGHMFTDVSGGEGNDSISVANRATGASNAGVFDFTLFGGGGNDSITTDFATNPLLMQRGGNLCIHSYGQDGNDTITTRVAATANSTGGNFDIAQRGGIGNDTLTLSESDPSKQVTVQPGGAMLVDGGSGTNTATVTSDKPVNLVNATKTSGSSFINASKAHKGPRHRVQSPFRVA